MMDNATLNITGLGNISGGTIKGGTAVNGEAGAGIGAGIFLQGSGTLYFGPGPDTTETYTVSDPIVDESGAVRTGSATGSSRGNGPDGLAAGGGGAWGITMSGNGTLVLSGAHSFSAGVTVSSGALDLTSYTNTAQSNLELDESAQLIVRPASAGQALQVGGYLIVSDQAVLVLNGYSSIVAEAIQVPTGQTDFVINLQLDSAGFTAGTAVELITTTQPIPSLLSVRFSNCSGYSATVSGNTIAVTMQSTDVARLGATAAKGKTS